ncbi:uncharacterized protein CDAR_11921 [Caerostris darwini]|uniref:Uncharacterized protein n=1 Tax=Caerostris darwini TaxID=1538125 RepID=A0AAV4VS12_9ARAC|nr:uncharacterized protein CDAR_11921 [Caerostris darwini]
MQHVPHQQLDRSAHTNKQLNRCRSHYSFRPNRSLQTIVVSSLHKFLLERHLGRPRAQYGNWVTGVSPELSHWPRRLQPSGDLTPPPRVADNDGARGEGRGVHRLRFRRVDWNKWSR